MLCVLPTLHRLGYASSTDVIDVKGRVACEISSGDELLLTELLFNGVFNNLTAEQSVALLSCFVFQEKVHCYMLTLWLVEPDVTLLITRVLVHLALQADAMPKLKEHLSGPLKQMQVI